MEFLAPVRAGDVVEVDRILTRVGRRSRDLALSADVVCRAGRSAGVRGGGARPAARRVHRARDRGRPGGWLSGVAGGPVGAANGVSGTTRRMRGAGPAGRGVPGPDRLTCPLCRRRVSSSVATITNRYGL